jgi:hypothetical protein
MFLVQKGSETVKSEGESQTGQNVRKFLKLPIPPGGTKLWEQWKIDCDILQGDVIPICRQALPTGSLDEQYAAVLTLRRHGYEAWANGYNEDLIFKLRRVGDADWEIIHPQILDPKPTD